MVKGQGTLHQRKFGGLSITLVHSTAHERDQGRGLSGCPQFASLGRKMANLGTITQRYLLSQRADGQRLCTALSWQSAVTAGELRARSPLPPHPALKDPCLSHLHPSWCHDCPSPHLTCPPRPIPHVKGPRDQEEWPVLAATLNPGAVFRREPAL